MSITIRSPKGASLTIGTARITRKTKMPSGAMLDVPVKGMLGPKMPGEKALQEFSMVLADGTEVFWDHEAQVVFPKGIADARLWLIDEEGQQVRSICARAGGPRPKIDGDPAGRFGMPGSFPIDQAKQMPDGSYGIPVPDPMTVQSGPSIQGPGAFGSGGTVQTSETPGADFFPGVGDPHQKRSVPSPIQRSVSPGSGGENVPSSAYQPVIDADQRIGPSDPHDPHGTAPKTMTFMERRCRVCGDGFTTLSATRSCCDAHAGSVKRG